METKQVFKDPYRILSLVSFSQGSSPEQESQKESKQLVLTLKQAFIQWIEKWLRD